MHIFSFFTGIGFLDLGFEDENFSVVYTNENTSSFAEGYKYARLEMNYELPAYGEFVGDVRELLSSSKKNELHDLIKKSRSSGELVGFIAGPPCPDFSVGGKNKGRSGEKGILSQSYCELINDQRPDFFLFENVKGLWRTKKHRAFYEELKLKFEGMGYILTDKLVNSIEFGAPQDRDRIILMGFNAGLLQDLNIPVIDGEINFPWKKYKLYDKQSVFNLPWPTLSEFFADSVLSKPNGIIDQLTVEYWFNKNNVENHLNSDMHFKPKAGLPKMQIIPEGDVSKKSYKRLHRWRYSPTAAYGNNEVHLHPYKVRRISVSEALAIQSLPKDFKLNPNMTLTDAFKSIGNGVPYLLSRALAKSISDFLEQQ